METLKTILFHPFFWGFVLGSVFCTLSLWSHYKTRCDFKRYKKILSDKLDIEAEKQTEIKQKLDTLRSENENLRMKINASQVQGDAKSFERELEIYARAEKIMVIAAPGFAPAWEKAKEAAYAELETEEAGKSLPRRIFKKFFTKSSVSPATESEVIEALPSESVTKSHS